MGADKAALEVEGERLADRGARVLRTVCSPVLEVGPGHTDMDAVVEDPPGGGPLAAVAAGGRELRRREHWGPTIVLAVDLPLVTEDFLRFLDVYPGDGAVVPFVAGEPQPLCARYSAEDLARAEDAVRAGERAVRAFLQALPEVQWAGPRMWGHVADEGVLADVDTPADLRRLGLKASSGGGVEQ
jgi:molybdopterin-guanine dinucleotide biosynthesis protein A